MPQTMLPAAMAPEDILRFWFPEEGLSDNLETYGAFWDSRMQGGMDDAIVAQYADVTSAAAEGRLDHWAATAKGRLALLIVLDQFPRSLWRDTPAAFAQDIQATRLALDGIENGDVLELEPWEMTFFVIAISHCEGPDHMERMNRLDAFVELINSRLPEHLSEAAPMLSAQHERVKNVIRSFGRHPHRNAILSRRSTAAEVAYIDAGDFPHVVKQAEA